MPPSNTLLPRRWARAGLFTLVATVLAAPAWSATCRVNASATGTNTGADWPNAYTSLQSALTNASCNEVWVAKGVYKPTTSTTDTNASFSIQPGVQVYGGFKGDGSETTRSQADPAVNRTVLSGDIGGDDVTDADGIVLDATPSLNQIVGNNSGTVVLMDGTTAAGVIGSNTVLDGVVITGGSGKQHPSLGVNAVGGLYCNGGGTGHACSPLLSRLWVSGNRAGWGGGVFLNANNGASAAVLRQSLFSGNYASSGGGAVFSYYTTATLAQLTFHGNTAGWGAAMQSQGGSPRIVQSTLVNNQAADATWRSTVHVTNNGTPTLEQVVWAGNTSGATTPVAIPDVRINTGGSPTVSNSRMQAPCPADVTCTGLITTDEPQLGSLQYNGGATKTMLPAAGSPMVDAVACLAAETADQRGVARPQGTQCDIGAVERRAGTYALDIAVAGTGAGSVSGGMGACASTSSSCSAAYSDGDPLPVTLVATPTAGSTFTGWTDACTNTTGDCVVTMDAARIVTANFALNTYTVTGTANPAEGGSVSCSPNPVNHDSTTTCTPTAQPGYMFTGWGGDCSGMACTLANVTADKSVTATFALNTYAITTSANPAEGGSVSCSPNPVNHGSTATCTTTAQPGYMFTGWGGDCSGSGAATTCSLANVASNKTVSANFAVVQTSFNGTTVPGAGTAAGTASASFTGGGATCRFDTSASTAFVAAPAALPAGQTMPHGMLQFKLVGCDTSPVTMSVTWPAAVQGLSKWGKAAPGAEPTHFAPTGLNVIGNVTTFTVQDGQLGDDDWTPNGEIVDPVGPTVPLVAALNPTPVPTLGQWALVLLSLMAAALGMGTLRCRVHGAI